MSAVTPGQADEIPEAYARYIRATFPPEVLRDAPNEIAGRWKHMTSPREQRFWAEVDAALSAGDRIVRDVLEALCRRDGLPLECSVIPGEPARNYELADRLGIGHVFGLKPQADAPGCPASSLEEALLANVDALNDLVRDIFEAYPDTSGISEWRDRAGALHVHDPDGKPYRALTEDDLFTNGGTS